MRASDVRPDLAPLPPSLGSSDAGEAAGSSSKTRGPWRTLAQVGAALLLGGAGALFGWWIAGAVPEPPEASGDSSGAADVALMAAGALVGLWTALAAHEGGHLVGGRLVGFRFALFVVGPLRVYRTAEGVRLGLNRSLALYGGLAASLPTDARALRRRTAWMVAGGPLASLLGGGLALGAFALGGFTGDGPAWHALLGTWLLVFGLGSLGIALVTLVPAKTSGFYTDGARLWKLWRGGASGARDEAVTTVSGLSISGTRPRDWPPELVEAACSVPDGSLFDGLARQLAYAHALDSGRPAEARAYLQEGLGRLGALPPATRADLLLEAAFFEAAFRTDAQAARAWLKRAGAQAGRGALSEASAPDRAEAAVLLAEGRPAEAALAARRARKALALSVDPGGALLLRDLLDALLERAEARRAEATNGASLSRPATPARTNGSSSS